MAKITREKYKTRNNVFDAFTERNLFELASKGLFDEETMSPIKIGKEANVFSVTKDGEKRVVKIYRLETCDFNANEGVLGLLVHYLEANVDDILEAGGDFELDGEGEELF